MVHESKVKKNDGGIRAGERLAYVALKCPSGKFVDASVVAPGDGLAKPVRFLEPAGRLDLRSVVICLTMWAAWGGSSRVDKSMASLFFHPVVVAWSWSWLRLGWLQWGRLWALWGLRVGKRSWYATAGGLGCSEPPCKQAWLGSRPGRAGAWRASWLGCLRRAWSGLDMLDFQIVALLGVLAFGAQPELWTLACTLGGVFGAGGPGLELGSLVAEVWVGRLGGVAGDGDLVGGGWNGSYSVEAAGLWTSSKLAMSFMGAPPWATCAGCAWSRLVGASVALNVVVAESVVSELEEWTSVMAELEN